MAPDPAAAQSARPDLRPDGVTSGRLVVLGGGEHAAVIVDAAGTRPDAWTVAGYATSEPSADLELRFPGLEWLGPDAAAGTSGDACIVAFGGGTAPGRRAGTVAALAGRTWATVIHATASVSATATVAGGVFVGAGAVVQTGALIGPHAIVNSGSVVEHDVRVGAYVHVAPGAVIGGGAHIGEGAFIGLGARVRDHVTVGDGAVVAMGAVVVADVSPRTTVAGIPARETRAR